MKQIVVISGKGGTGKTVLTASFASITKSKVMADCDVDAADLHLLLHPDIKEKHEFKGGFKPVIDEKKCTKCGKCVEVCRFSAITKDPIVIDLISCEGCGVCSKICPEGAIRMEENICGEWYVSDTKYGPMVHAKLGIAEENSGKLVTVVRQEAKKIGEKNNLNLVIVDGPPGIGCPVIASLSGIDLALIVTEPTLSGIHDMERVVGVAKHFGVKPACIINKYDINWEKSAEIEKWCQAEGIPIMGKIPYEPEIVKSVVKAIPAVEYSKNIASEEIENIWSRLEKELVLVEKNK